MSFALKVKEEIAYSDFGNKEQMITELNAFCEVNGTLSISDGKKNLKVSIDNASTAKRVYSIIKELAPEKEIALSVRKRMKLQKRSSYTMLVKDASDLLKTIGLSVIEGGHAVEKYLDKFENRSSYIKAVFLACGSISDPKTSNYHLELAVKTHEQAIRISNLLNGEPYKFISKIIKRRNQEVVYIKRVEMIGDFLKLIGASETLHEFQDAWASRDYMNSFVRMNNMEIANQMKTLKASNKIIDEIQFLDDNYGLENLSESIQRVAMLRLQSPEDSLAEIGEQYEEEFGKKLGKSGVSHRIRKIRELVKKIKGGEDID